MLLDIQDPNITFEKNCIEEGTFKGKPCKYVTGKLTYDPEACNNCGIKNEDYIVTKNGTQMSRITLPISGVQPTYLRLQKQRFICHACNSSFTAETPIVQKNCRSEERRVGKEGRDGGWRSDERGKIGGRRGEEGAREQ